MGTKHCYKIWKSKLSMKIFSFSDRGQCVLTTSDAKVQVVHEQFSSLAVEWQSIPTISNSEVKYKPSIGEGEQSTLATSDAKVMSMRSFYLGVWGTKVSVLMISEVKVVHDNFLWCGAKHPT